MQRPGTPIAFHFDENDVDSSRDSGTVENIWWLPESTSSDQLILSNASGKSLSVSVIATDTAGGSYPETVALGPQQTQRLNLRSVARQAAASKVMGGLSISIGKGAGSLIVSHIVYDETTGLSAIMKTFDRDANDKPGQHTLRAPMMALATPDPTLRVCDFIDF